MSIIDENGNQIMRVGMVHKIMAGACVALISAQTVALLSWGAWVTSTVSQHAIDIAVLRSFRTTGNIINPTTIYSDLMASDCFDKPTDSR
jgi:hypothetical protein